jgi:alpha-mannosidase
LHNGTVFSYITNNYNGDDEKRFQGGVFTFHYAISSAAQFDPASLARFGREQARPLEIETVNSVHKFDLPPEPLELPEGGFIKLATSDVILSTWKPAEDGSGYILRFYNTTDKPVVAHVGFPLFEFESLYRTNGLEINQAPLPAAQTQVTLELNPPRFTL